MKQKCLNIEFGLYYQLVPLRLCEWSVRKRTKRSITLESQNPENITLLQGQQNNSLS